MPSVARQKILHLKLAFVGRGNDINKVVDLYCEFLTALEKHKRKRVLHELLKKADVEMSALLAEYGGK